MLGLKVLFHFVDIIVYKEDLFPILLQHKSDKTVRKKKPEKKE